MTSPFTGPVSRRASSGTSNALSVDTTAQRIVQSAQPAPPSDPSLNDLIRALRHRLPSILALMALTTGLGLAYIVTAKPQYTASSAIFIDPRTRKIVNEELPSQSYNVDTSLFETQISIIGSDTILRRVAVSEKLDKDPDFVPAQQSQTGLLSQLRDSIRGPRAAIPPIDQAVTSLARRIKVRRAQNTYVVTVDVTTPEPAKSARIAGALLKAYQEDQSQVKTDAATRANTAIDGRLEELRSQVRTAELKVDDYRRQNRIVTSEGGLVNEQQLTKLNTELAVVRGQLVTTKARLDEMQATLRRGVSAESLTEAMSSPVVQRLREQLAQAQRREAALASQLQSRHPVMVDATAQVTSLRGQIRGELTRITEQVQNEHTVATSREREILRVLGESQREVSETTTSQIRLRELEREADASREVLRTFLSRAKETEEQGKIGIIDARVISPATVPGRPSSPNVPMVLALSALSGLALGTLRALIKGLPPAAVARGQLAQGQSDRGQIDRGQPGQRLPFASDNPDLKALGSIPPLGRRGPLDALVTNGRTVGPADVLTALNDRTNPAFKAYRTGVEQTAARLRALAAPGRPQTALLVSLEKGAGTSLSALALAHARASAGEQVLLIDAASADPALSLEFAGDLNQDEPCILDSKDHLAAIASREPESGLMFLPIALADLRTLTGSQRKRLATGISKLAADYQLVLIDGGAIDDDDAITALTDLVSMVVVVAPAGSGTTDIHLLAETLNVSPNQIAGFVATAKPTRHAA